MTEQSIKHLHAEKMRKLQETIGFLDSYKPVKGEKHVIKQDNSDITDEGMTILLNKLGQINQEREFIINKLMGIKN